MRRVKPNTPSLFTQIYCHLFRTELGRIRVLVLISIGLLVYLSRTGLSQGLFVVPPVIFVSEVLVTFTIGLFSVVYAFELSSTDRPMPIAKPTYSRSDEERILHRKQVARRAAIKL